MMDRLRTIKELPFVRVFRSSIGSDILMVDVFFLSPFVFTKRGRERREQKKNKRRNTHSFFIMKKLYLSLPPTKDWRRVVNQRCTSFSLLPIPVLRGLVERLQSSRILPSNIQVDKLSLANLCDILGPVFYNLEERKHFNEKSHGFIESLDSNTVSAYFQRILSQPNFEQEVKKTLDELQWLSPQKKQMTDEELIERSRRDFPEHSGFDIDLVDSINLVEGNIPTQSARTVTVKKQKTQKEAKKEVDLFPT